MPSIFTTFTQYDPEAQIGLRLLSPLTTFISDSSSIVHCSVFRAYTCTDSIDIPSGPLQTDCVAKLVYRHYGVAVHQALYHKPEAPNPQALNWEAPTFAPRLRGCSSLPGIQACVYIMDFLRPPTFVLPGWYTLANVRIKAMVAKKVDVIYPVLKNIVNRLFNLGLVHGDLRPNNLMIKMKDCAFMVEPVEIKVVDFEWADKVDIARYPQSRNEDIGYPGKPGGLIGRNDDLYMIDKWRKDMKNHMKEEDG